MWRSLFLAVTLAAVGSKGAAQSMTPMRGEISSFEEEFTVRVFPYNPYPHSIRVAIKAYDQDFRPIEADVMPPEMVIGSMSSRSAIVSVGFKNKKSDVLEFVRRAYLLLVFIQVSRRKYVDVLLHIV